jgi:glycerol-3-phosphate acyltransferase PlsY
VVFFTTRYASLASIVAGLSLPAIAVLLGYPWPVIAFAGAAAAAILVLHRSNVRRLLAGTENRASLRRATAPAGPSSGRAA